MSAARSNDSEIAWVTESSTSSAAKTSIINGCEMVTWFELEDSDDEDSDDEDSDDEDSDDEDSDDEDSDDEDSDEHDPANKSAATKANQIFTKSPLHRTATAN